MNRNNLPSQSMIQHAQRRLAQQSVPRGAQLGVLAGAEQAQQMQPQPQMPMHPAVMQQMLARGIPQGADAAALAGCGPWGCGGVIPSPFAGYPAVATGGPFLQNQSLLGVFVQPATAAATTLEISCGNTFFHGCGARSFTPAGSILLTEITSGFNTDNRLCPGSGIDVAYFNNPQDCYCEFDFGCFSNLAPLLITFDPIDTQSVLQPLNMVIVGQRLSFFNECWPPYFPPAIPPGAIPTPYGQPGAYAAPYMPPAIPPV
jgi:hypothetical protein